VRLAVNQKILLTMKNKLLAGFALLIMAITVCSCATSKRYGCPTVSIESKKSKV